MNFCNLIWRKISSNDGATVWKNAKFTLIENIFRQITSLVISLVKTLISRKIGQKGVRVNFHNFHTVRFPQYTVEKWKNYSHLTQKIFRQINSLIISLVKSLLSRNFCQIDKVRVNFRNFHTVCNEEKRV